MKRLSLPVTYAPLALCALSALLCTRAPAQTTPVYRNDFATRLCAGPTAAKNYTLPYLTGTLCSTNGLAAYADQSAIQDGWVEGLNNNDVVARVLDSSGNPLACLCRDVYGKYAYVRHPIGNVLTNGLVRYSGDMRPPRRWSNTSRNMAMHLGYDRLMSVQSADAEEYYKHQALLVGFRSSNSTDTDFKLFAYQGNGSGTNGTMVNGSASVDTTHWYRFVALLNLDANTYTAAVYDMGTDQPTLETALPGSPVETFGGATFGFRMDLTAATGGLTTLALSAYGVMGGDDASTDITLTARYDNLAIDSKPAGAPDYTRVYANDFATRTITRTVPDPLEFGYADDTTVPNGGYGYTVGQKLTLDNIMEFPNGSILGSGTDAWVRRNTGAATLTVASDGNAYAKAWHPSGNYITACQRIGNTVTAGTVQVMAEITPPDKWYTTPRSVTFFVGDDGLYRGEKNDSITNSYYHRYAARFGFSGDSNTDIRFLFYDGNGANSATGVYGTATVNPANWYRFIATLDLTNATYDVNVYDMGTQHSVSSNATPSMLVQTFSGGFRRRIGANPLTELQGLSAICLGAYGMAGGFDGTNNIPGTAGYDNIVLAATLPEQAPVVIYNNYFSTRNFTNITGAARHAPLAGAIDTLGGSQDSWVRRNNGTLPADVTAAGGNPNLRLSHTGADHAYYMQPLGADITHNILLAQLDINPPAYWVWNSHAATLYLGDDRFWQGNRNATLSFTKFIALNFGLGSTNEWGNSWGVYPNVSIFATDGDGDGNSSNLFAAASINTANWYRFKAEISPAANAYSLKVYDMGTAQPTLESPTPAEPVATFEGLRFRTNMRKPGDPDTRLEALSSMSLAGFGIRGGQLYPPEELVLIDNLLFSVKRTGTLISVL